MNEDNNADFYEKKLSKSQNIFLNFCQSIQSDLCNYSLNIIFKSNFNYEFNLSTIKTKF
jgi:hypothetical protein